MNRHRNFDYSLDGFYFITTCVKHFVCCFGKIQNGQIILNKYGEIVKQQLLWLPKRFPYIRLDEWCVIPNHAHAIMVIDRSNIRAGHDHAEIVGTVGTGRDLSLPSPPMKIKSISEIVGAFKTTSSKSIHLSGLNTFQWQRSFYDEVIRDETAWKAIRWYIKNNPKNWRKDKNNSLKI